MMIYDREEIAKEEFGSDALKYLHAAPHGPSLKTSEERSAKLRDEEEEKEEARQGLFNIIITPCQCVMH